MKSTKCLPRNYTIRNLCIDGGFDICAEMFNKGITAPLKTFVPKVRRLLLFVYQNSEVTMPQRCEKISNTLSQFLASPKDAPENAQQLVYEFADNVITILWCLS